MAKFTLYLIAVCLLLSAPLAETTAVRDTNAVVQINGGTAQQRLSQWMQNTMTSIQANPLVHESIARALHFTLFLGVGVLLAGVLMLLALISTYLVFVSLRATLPEDLLDSYGHDVSIMVHDSVGFAAFLPLSFCIKPVNTITKRLPAVVMALGAVRLFMLPMAVAFAPFFVLRNLYPLVVLVALVVSQFLAMLGIEAWYSGPPVPNAINLAPVPNANNLAAPRFAAAG